MTFNTTARTIRRTSPGGSGALGRGRAPRQRQAWVHGERDIQSGLDARKRWLTVGAVVN